MHHLSRVAADNESNSMTASNLAIVFAPTLMKTTQENIGMGAVGETKHHARVIELLILYVNYIFGPVELHMPQMRNDLHHRVPKRPSGRNNRNSSRCENSDLISSQTERRNVELNDEFNIPGKYFFYKITLVLTNFFGKNLVIIIQSLFAKFCNFTKN